jgi:hypothetical protein
VLSRSISLVALAVLSSSSAAACSSNDHAPHSFGGFDPDAFAIDTGADGGTGAFDVPTDAASFNCSAGADAGICACTEIGQSPPTLYVLLDRSASMSDPIPPGSTSKWDLVRSALFDVKNGALRRLGGRVAVGMSLFPGSSTGDGCGVGAPVFPITVGSKATYDALAMILAGQTPTGATPTASSIVGLTPKLKAIVDRAYLLLATDGAPNCGDSPCTADRCQYDIEGSKLSDGTTCAPPLNCCDPSVVEGGGGWKSCVDSDATKAAVTALETAGIHTFVLGIPGSELYAADLDTLAVAGGAPQPPGGPRYYAPTDEASLSKALEAIAAKVVESCTITLSSAVVDPGITNVLLDGTLVPQDGTNGWSWIDSTHIELNGDACKRVTDGTVSNVQVAVGCKTVTR